MRSKTIFFVDMWKKVFNLLLKYIRFSLRMVSGADVCFKYTYYNTDLSFVSEFLVEFCSIINESSIAF